jgi:ABC-type multidrug transport system ATPase subunit
MSHHFFKVENLFKRYGDAVVVNNLSFDIAPGECLGVIGPNGAGKTTTIRMCLGHTMPDGGSITAMGLPMPHEAMAIKAQLGVVTQFDTLDPDFTCAENLLVYGRYFGMKDAAIKATTHFMDEAERLCNRLLVLDHGKKIAEGTPRDLIAAHLEPDVVEVFGVGAHALLESPLRAMAARVEVSGETVFFYTQDSTPLLQALAAFPQLRTLHRPANLEDLFLKLTGRQIREDA